MTRYLTHTGGTAPVREFVFVELTTPVDPGHLIDDAPPGVVAVSGFFERVGPDHPETRFAEGFRGIDFGRETR